MRFKIFALVVINLLEHECVIADYTLPALLTYQCSRGNSFNSGIWASSQEAADEFGRQVAANYPAFTEWYTFSSEGLDFCEAHNWSHTGFSPPDDGISGFLDKGNNCSYKSAGGEIVIGVGGSVFERDGVTYSVCWVTGELPKNKLSCPLEGDPVSVANGVLVENEIDYQSATLRFQRLYYSSGREWEREIGALWKHNFERKISFTWPEQVMVFREDGRLLLFYEDTSTGDWTPDPDVTDVLERLVDASNVTTGWKFINSSDLSVEIFNADGALQSVTYQTGLVQTLSYDSENQLTQVDDSNGRSLSFSYDEYNRIASMTDPDGGLYTYEYDANSNLISVKFPDNEVRQYLYENVSLPNSLTGVTDAVNNRYSTWMYDTEGRVISAGHSNGVDYTEFDYTYMDDAVDPRVTVTNELGKQTTYHYTTIHGVRKVTQVEGHQSANCAAANQSYTYDANGFKDLVTDWEGNITDYDHDARGLEVQRIEAKGTPQQRVITTQWHSDFRLPTKITEPDRVIDFSYDTQGLLLERKETPTP